MTAATAARSSASNISGTSRPRSSSGSKWVTCSSRLFQPLQHAAVVERVEDVRDALHDVFPVRQRTGDGLVRALELARRLLQVGALTRLALAPLRLGQPPALVE